MKIFIVEHLDPELEAWSSLEYLSIATECHTSQPRSQFILSGVSPSLVLPDNLDNVPGLTVTQDSVEQLFDKSKVCLLDPAAGKELRVEDGEVFDCFLFGGILGDDPPRDRTSELRQKGYEGRRLGPVQMTTDTAVRVTRMVVVNRNELDDIKFVDYPEIIINKNESTQMPFRYVKDEKGGPIMPQGMIDLIKNDAEKGLGDLL